jgi:hypothetical protein
MDRDYDRVGSDQEERGGLPGDAVRSFWNGKPLLVCYQSTTDRCNVAEE